MKERYTLRLSLESDAVVNGRSASVNKAKANFRESDNGRPSSAVPPFVLRPT